MSQNLRNENQEVSIASAILELRKRERKQKLEGSLEEFIRYFFPIAEGVDFIFKEHHFEIIEALERVYRLETTRLIINIPPGYGKTELVVVLFCAWCYAKTADCRFLHLSYTSELTSTNSVRIKDILGLQEFQELWPTYFSREINGKEHWKTDYGEFRGKSTGGAVTGFRAGRITPGFHGAMIIDDPIKPEDAESDILRKKMNKRLVNTAKSRIMHEDVPIIMIMQRIHDNDPAGFMLGGGTGDDWELLKIEAIRKDDEGNEYALWPEKDSLEYLQSYRTAAAYEFSSQYQQNPVPDGGVFFKRDDFNWYDLKQLPKGESFGSSDFATTDDAGDFTEHGIFRVTPDGKVYIHDWWGDQASSDVWIESLVDLAIAHSISMWSGETGPIKGATEPFLKRRLIERNHPMKLEWFSHAEASKEQNARGFQALVASGRVYVPRGTPWAEDLVDQLCRFPRGKFDDKVDVCSLLAKMINKLWALEAVTNTEKVKEPDTIQDLINRNRQKNRLKRTSNGRI